MGQNRYFINSQDVALYISYEKQHIYYKIAVSLFDLAAPWSKSEQRIMLSLGRGNKCPTDEAAYVFHAIGKDYEVALRYGSTSRRLYGHFDCFAANGAMLFDLTIFHLPRNCNVKGKPIKRSEMIISDPEVSNCVATSGRIEYNEAEYLFAPANSFASIESLSQSRSKCYNLIWGAASGLVGGKCIGFYLSNDYNSNCGPYRLRCSYAGRIVSIDRVIVRPAIDNYTILLQHRWSIETCDKKVTLLFYPTIDEVPGKSVSINRRTRQLVYGTFSGIIDASLGSVINVECLVGFMEMYN